LIDAYVGPEGVLMGSARANQTARESSAAREREQLRQRRQRELQRQQELYEAQLVALKHQYEIDLDAILRELEEDQTRETVAASQRLEMARLRHADVSVGIDENGSRKSRKGTVR
jgi:circadian clock protein KaiC